MTCTLSLGPDSTLSLRTPSGREILIPVSLHSTQWLWDILWNSSEERRNARRGYATAFPSQAVVDAWAKEVGEPRREASAKNLFEEKRQAALDKFGFDLKEIDL